MADPAALERDVTALIQERSVVRDPITPQMALYHDLRLYGDDAYEILSELSKRYGVSFTGFSFSAYFPSEGLLTALLRFRSPENWKRLTVGHLVAVVERRQWFEP